MIEIKGKKFRNLQEQVYKNMEDIEELKNTSFDNRSVFIVKMQYRNERLEDSDDKFYGTLTFLVNSEEFEDYSNLTFANLISVCGYVEVENVQEPMGVFDFDIVEGDNTKVQLLGLGSNWVLSVSAFTTDIETEIEIV